jgi:hypothetical protein
VPGGDDEEVALGERMLDALDAGGAAAFDDDYHRAVRAAAAAGLEAGGEVADMRGDGRHHRAAIGGVHELQGVAEMRVGRLGRSEGEKALAPFRVEVVEEGLAGGAAVRGGAAQRAEVAAVAAVLSPGGASQGGGFGRRSAKLARRSGRRDIEPSSQIIACRWYCGSLHCQFGEDQVRRAQHTARRASHRGMSRDDASNTQRARIGVAVAGRDLAGEDALPAA